MTALRDAARRFASLNPRPDTRPGETWNQLCALLMARFALAPASKGGIGWRAAPRAYGDAIVVARDSGILNGNPAMAPIGAWHFWDIGRYGHVGVDLSSGGIDVFMATGHLREGWQAYLGINSVDGYTRATGAKYLGWTTNYRGGVYNLPLEPAGTGGITPIGDDMTEPDVIAAIRDIQNKVSVSGAAYGAPQAALNYAQQIAMGGIFFPGAPYNAFQAIANQNSSILDAIGRLAGGQPVDVAALIRESEDRIKASTGEQLQAFGTALMADILTTLPTLIGGGADGITDEQRADITAAAAAGVREAFERAFAPVPTVATPTV